MHVLIMPFNERTLPSHLLTLLSLSGLLFSALTASRASDNHYSDPSTVYTCAHRYMYTHTCAHTRLSQHTPILPGCPSHLSLSPGTAWAPLLGSVGFPSVCPVIKAHAFTSCTGPVAGWMCTLLTCGRKHDGPPKMSTSLSSDSVHMSPYMAKGT